ncbi:hypothetical protein [Pandoraea apista]|uniref:hypothetical protein n=1 Tax=Pandoraea apista TaxID=93218 RepID=UPI00058AB7A7|nr:hypothetical protein [Pandoraea apista]AJE98974.1 hypothetical protein SG18_13620 [Pandoraea apista]AKH73059.1 hypothetical protein XM39_13815 [Pandoraea apista]AKI61444.1 hypothetical protein AA956_06075 [Pandoraea apista]
MANLTGTPKRRFVRSSFVAAYPRACRALIKANFDTQPILRNASQPPRFAQATTEDCAGLIFVILRRRIFLSILYVIRRI